MRGGVFKRGKTWSYTVYVGRDSVTGNKQQLVEGSDTTAALVALQDAIQRGADAGMAFVTIAGNGDAKGVGYDLDTTPNYPASLTCHFPTGGDCMIVVTAIDKTGKLARFANFGATTVDIGAPGVAITSTFPFGKYLSASGTSFAVRSPPPPMRSIARGSPQQRRRRRARRFSRLPIPRRRCRA